VTPLTALLREEIERTGPIRFSRFMSQALYHPEHGYYRRPRDPFGVSGDFFTASQVEPVFGRLIAQYLSALDPQPPARTLVELGAGRCELEPYFGRFDYVAVDVDRGTLPQSFSGFVFANEFLDALPVDTAVVREGRLRELRVGAGREHFVWVEAEEVSPAALAYSSAAHTWPLEEGTRVEISLPALEWIARLAASLHSGYVLFVDYGYTRRESIRFPEGTLMSYRRHAALDDVLASPGEQDITAHVAFSAIEEESARRGFEVVRFENIASMLLRAGEADQFARALEASDESESLRLRMQLKTLLFGMGETFRTLLLRKSV
jgi:SAM-dependent MidA family methyltransferase